MDNGASKVCAGVGFHGGEKGDVLGCARSDLDSSESSKGLESDFVVGSDDAAWQ